MVQARDLVRRAGIWALALLTVGGAGLYVGGPADAAPAAATRYVATTGNDGADEVANNCLKPAQPCKTVQHAVDEAAAGDTVSIAAGTYTASVTIDKSLTLSGAADGATKLTAADGNPTLQLGATEKTEELPAITLENLAVDDNAKAPGVVAFGVALTVQNSEIGGNTAVGLLTAIGSVQLTDSQIMGTQAPAGDGGDDATLGLGGGDGLVVLAGSVTVERSVLGDNDGSGLLAVGLTSEETDAPGPSLATVVDIHASTIVANQFAGVLNELGQVTIGTSTLAQNFGAASVTAGGTTTILDSTLTGTRAFPGTDGPDEQGGVVAAPAEAADPGLPAALSPAQRQSVGKALVNRVTQQNAALGKRVGTAIAMPQVSKTPPTSVTVTGSIVAGQSGLPDCSGTVVDGGYNLSSDKANSCGFGAAKHSLTKTDAKLRPLDDNGGPTPTQLPGKGSLAIDAIPSGTAGCTADAADQRGEPRLQPVGGRCDIGAVELAAKPIVISPDSLAKAVVGQAYKQVFTATGGAYPTYTWTLAPGSTLPPGLTLSVAGVLSGTPTTAGSYSFTVSVNDPVLKKFTLAVDPATAPAGGGSPIANTGAPVGALSAVGGGAVFAGFLVLFGAGRIGRRMGRHRS